MAFNLGEFHRINRTRIIKEWVRKLHTEVGEQYSKRPLKELQRTVSEAYNAKYHVIVHGDYHHLNQFIDKITRLRLEAGFLLSDVQKAFEIYRSVILPLLAKEVPTEEFRDCVNKINHCLAYSIHRSEE